jgi:class 3 adenylate cyclase
MQKALAQRMLANAAAGRPVFQMRLGIHTGPVVAGVVGSRKFAYDIWGDTVNIAARMESSGQAGEVNISEATYRAIQHAFDCTPRGKVAAKSLGEIEMYFVVGERSA